MNWSSNSMDMHEIRNWEIRYIIFFMMMRLAHFPFTMFTLFSLIFFCFRHKVHFFAVDLSQFSARIWLFHGRYIIYALTQPLLFFTSVSISFVSGHALFPRLLCSTLLFIFLSPSVFLFAGVVTWHIFSILGSQEIFKPTIYLWEPRVFFYIFQNHVFFFWCCVLCVYLPIFWWYPSRIHSKRVRESAAVRHLAFSFEFCVLCVLAPLVYFDSRC